jgi:hypothetical protein
MESSKRVNYRKYDDTVENASYRLTRRMKARVKEAAAAESRSLSWTVELLLDEALTARAEKESAAREEIERARSSGAD